MALDDPDRREIADLALDQATTALPDGSRPKTVVKQAGWGALVIGCLLGNLPLSAIVEAAAKGNAKLDVGAVEIYLRALVLFTPWVLLIAVPVFLGLTKQMPALPVQGYVWGAAALIVAGLVISPSIGGVVPLDVPTLTSGSPPAVVEWMFDALGAYAAIYGAAVMAGFVEGALFGYWAAYLATPEAPARPAGFSEGTPSTTAGAGTASPTARRPPLPSQRISELPFLSGTERPSPPVEPVSPAPAGGTPAGRIQRPAEPPAWVPTTAYESRATVRHRDRQWAVRPGRRSIPGIPPPNDSANWQLDA